MGRVESADWGPGSLKDAQMDSGSQAHQTSACIPEGIALWRAGGLQGIEDPPKHIYQMGWRSQITMGDVTKR
jgi:hypothetical protein